VPDNPNEISRETIERFYVVELKPARVVAESLGVPLWKVYDMLKRYEIPVRRPGGKRAGATKAARNSILSEKPERFCAAAKLDGTRCVNWPVRGRKYCMMHLNAVLPEVKNGTNA